MKITVIATGFEREYLAAMADKVQPLQTRQPAAGASNPRIINQPAAHSSQPTLRVEDDLDVPTFMRKKAD